MFAFNYCYAYVNNQAYVYKYYIDPNLKENHVYFFIT